MKQIFLLAVATALALGGEVQTPGQQEFNNAVERIEADRQVKMKVAADAYLKRLQAELERLTKSGNLDEALKVREEVKRVEALVTPDKKDDNAAPFIPDFTINLDRLTVPAWDAAPGRLVAVDARALCDTGITITEGQKYVVIPHPEDKWREGTVNAYSNFRGEKIPGTSGPWDGSMVMLWRLDPGHKISGNRINLALEYPGGGVIKGTGAVFGKGKLLLMCGDKGSWTDNDGVIRVKIVRVR